MKKWKRIRELERKLCSSKPAEMLRDITVYIRSPTAQQNTLQSSRLFIRFLQKQKLGMKRSMTTEGSCRTRGKIDKGQAAL